MARPPTSIAPPSRKRRTADEARSAILDAAERMLVVAGPAGIRLQEVAAAVGVSHPTVLHHFGNREKLVEAVVARALDSLRAGLLAAVQTQPKGSDEVLVLLDSVFDTMVRGGHGRAVLWLALSGYSSTMDRLHIRSVAAAVHDVRRARVKEINARDGTKKRVPTLEDTYFTVLLPALALLSMSVMDVASTMDDDAADVECSPRRFRAWLATVIHDHLDPESPT